MQREEGWSPQPQRLWPNLPGVAGPDPPVGCGGGRELLLHHSGSHGAKFLGQFAGTRTRRGSVLHLMYLNRLFASQATQSGML